MYALKPVSADIFDAEYLIELDTNQKIMIVGDAQQKCKVLWGQRKNLHFTDLEADARGQVEHAYKKFLNQEFADLVYFEPQYLKDFQPGVKAK
jgi:tRNA threonylcarbamoyladenosine biosynthesis protein TsaB